MSEKIKPYMRTIDTQTLIDIAYGINGAGGGGNIKELYNPDRGEKEIVGLAEELGNKTIPFCSWQELGEETVCCVARLGSPGAKADYYAQEAAKAVVEGLKVLSQTTNQPFPVAIFPVEATAGQMARAARAALAASKELGQQISLLDGDICGGLAVPAVPLAFGIDDSLKAYPNLVLIELKTEGEKVMPIVESLTASTAFELERLLRERASKSEMGAVWFAWFLISAEKFPLYFTTEAISSSIKRGQIVRRAIEKNTDPAKALLESGEAEMILEGGRVTRVNREEIAGFAQFSYVIFTDKHQELVLAARNEFIILYNPVNGEILVKAPKIIAVMDKNGPIQSHILREGQEVSIIAAKPQCIQNKPELENKWCQIWNNYWQQEKERGLWNHPY